MEPKYKEWRLSSKVWIGVGFNKRFGLGFSIDKYNLIIDIGPFWILLEY
jgi:hypothetical protein